MATTETDSIAIDLTGLLGAIGRAQQMSVAAAEHAGTLAGRTAPTGLQHVATALAEIRDQIGGLRGALDAAAGPAHAAYTAVRGVTDRTEPAEAGSRLHTATGRLDAALDALAEVGTRLATVRDRVQATLSDGQPAPLLASLDGVHRAVAAAARRGEDARGRIAATIVRSGHAA